MNEPSFLTITEVLHIHEAQIRLFGGEPGLRDKGLLISALAMPRAGMNGEFFHSDLFAMAAALQFHIVCNHPFVDGNKRTGIVAALIFLDVNGVRIKCTNDELTDLVYEMAKGRVDKDSAAQFFRKHQSEQ